MLSSSAGFIRLVTASTPNVLIPAGQVIARTLVSRSPGLDPLDLLRQHSIKHNLCDETGKRLPNAHWVCAIAIAPGPSPNDTTANPVNLRTVHVQRVTPAGIDFVLKSGDTASQLTNGTSLSMVHLIGHFMRGESTEQWRGEGPCANIKLDSELVSVVPAHTLTSIIGAVRLQKEEPAGEKARKEERTHVASRQSHITEVWQRVRMELQNNEISPAEMSAAVQAFRFQPARLEYMYGGPDSVQWDRWEWLRDMTTTTDDSRNALKWLEAQRIVPH
jgi:hypothetical protein